MLDMPPFDAVKGDLAFVTSHLLQGLLSWLKALMTPTFARKKHEENMEKGPLSGLSDAQSA